MAYQYSNPYAQSTAQAAPSRSTFGATRAAGSSQRCQLLFTGLPPDVGERDLLDTLFAPPLSLPASTTSVKSFYSQDEAPLGMALVAVGNEQDAERIRREYSGQLIDNIHHILGPTQVLPPRSATPALTGASSSRSNGQAASSTTSTPKPTSKATPKAEGKAPGLQLLSRLNKPGSKEQQALLARQKANMKKGPKDLLARLANQRPAPAGARAKVAQTAKATGAAKVARAKANVAKDKMDVDKPAVAAPGKKDKGKPKTQEDLDAEMVLWERQRRFASQT